jgi:hypothetical protein
MAETESKKFKYRIANNQEGCLLRSLDGTPALFRIYEENGEFKDYKVSHHDLQIKIIDESAEFVASEDGKDCYLDYSRKVLGRDKKYSS